MVDVNYDYSVDYYELIGALETLGEEELRKKYLKLFQRLDVEVRTKIPQRIQREAKGELRKKLGREPTEHEERSYVYEKTQDFDARKRDKEYVEKSRKLQLINKAREIFSDDSKKRQYDSFHNRQRKATCYDHTAGGTEEFRRNDRQIRKWNSCYFCSQLCLNDYLINNGISTPKTPTAGSNELNAPCCKCQTKQATDWKYRKVKNLWYCGDCYNNVPNCSHCNFKKAFLKINGKMFCRREHFDEWERLQKDSQNPKPNPALLKKQYWQKLTGLEGWLDLLTEDERDRFKAMLSKAYSEPEFEKVISQTEALIAIKKTENPGEEIPKTNLSDEIQKVISEIKAELEKEPKINEEEINFDFQDWQDYLLNSANLNQLAGRKGEVLSNIKSIRRQQKGPKNLSQVREEAIQQIREELSKKPPIKNEELTSPDWENEINEISDEFIINQIRSKILAEIRNKRINNSEKNNLNDLLLRAHEQPNWNNHLNLFGILRKIKKLRSSSFYQEKASEVEAIENQLQTLDPEQFKESIEQLLDCQFQDNGLNDSNTDEEVKQAIDDWKTNPTRENLAKAEEAICQNAADNKLIEICQEVETKLSKANLSKKQAKKLVEKIQEIISKNDYQALTYEKNRKTVDNFLERLNSWEGDRLEEQPLLPKWFWPVAITSCLGIAVVGVILWWKGWTKRRVIINISKN